MLGTIVEDRYLVEAELGAGAMGHVYRARHVKVGRQVAIKVMHADLARVSTIVERFAREARIAARLDHPNLVSVLDVGVTPDSRRLPLIVLELAPGVPLLDLMIDAMPREQVVNVIRQLLCGLDHAHDAGLVHRDLKPDNILVEQRADGTLVPRIVDFGIAVCNREDDPIANRRLTEANTVIGTPFYMSPEQAMAKPLDARSDLFSLGVIMYELLAGMPPFTGSGLDVAYANATKDAPTISERSDVSVDPLLEAFVHKLMARRLTARFQTAHEALAVLELIETDRIAAARALSGDVGPIAPIAVSAVGSGPMPVAEFPTGSDSLSTLPVGVTTATPVAVVARRSTKITRVEHIAGMRPARRRMLWAGALAAAALTAVVGWGFRPEIAAPRVQASLATVAFNDDAVPATPALVPPSFDPVTATPIETAAVVVAPKGVTRKRAGKPVAAGRIAVVAPERSAAPTPAVEQPVIAPSKVLATRYLEVGRALRGAPDALWARYRLIRINDALANEASQKQALIALADIERALPR